MSRFLTAAALVLSLAAFALADDCPDGRCPLKQPASMYVVAPAATGQQATPHAVRVEWVTVTRAPLFPRLASIRAKHPLRRFAARLFWRY